MISKYKSQRIHYKTTSFHREEKPVVDIVLLYEKLIQPVKKNIYSRNLLVLCPIHNEKHPSMVLYPKTNSCYCFACGYTADIYKFVMDTQNITFKESLEFIKHI
jgi:DNA primase